MQSVTPMQLVLTLMDHTTAVVFMATVEMEGIAQVHKYLIAAHKSTRFPSTQESTCVKLVPLTVTLMLPVWTEMEAMTVNVMMDTLAMELTVKV